MESQAQAPDMSRILQRVRKMMALANDKAASDGERENAMRMAHATLASIVLASFYKTELVQHAPHIVWMVWSHTAVRARQHSTVQSASNDMRCALEIFFQCDRKN